MATTTKKQKKSTVYFLAIEDRHERNKMSNEMCSKSPNLVRICIEELRESMNPHYALDADKIALAAAINILRNAITLGKDIVVDCWRDFPIRYQWLESTAQELKATTKEIGKKI